MITLRLVSDPTEQSGTEKSRDKILNFWILAALLGQAADRFVCPEQEAIGTNISLGSMEGIQTL